MITQKLEVGEISSQMFMSLVLDTIYTQERRIAKSESSKRNWQMEIKCEAEHKVLVTYKLQEPYYTTFCQVYFQFYSGYIHIKNGYCIEFKDNIRVEAELEKKIAKTFSEMIDLETNMLIDLLTKNIMKDLHLFHNIINCFPYMFNFVTCLNVDKGKVENIRLSQYYDILTSEKIVTFGNTFIQRYEDHGIVYSEERGECIASSLNRNEYGNVYTLSADKITELKPTRVQTTWIPICAIERRTNLPLNKIIVLQDAQNAESQPEYLYMSTKGIFYNGEIVSATIGYYEDRLIIYKDGNVLITACTLDTGTVAIAHCVGDSETIKEYNIKALEEISEANNIESLQPFTSQLAELADDVIFDGSKFLPFNENWDKLVKKQPTKQQNKNKQDESKQDESKQDESQQDESQQNQKPKAWQIILLIIAVLLWLLW